VHLGGRDEVRQALDAIEANAGAKSVVLISAKADGFIAGADINMLAAAKDEKELEEVCPHARVRAHTTHRHRHRHQEPHVCHGPLSIGRAYVCACDAAVRMFLSLSLSLCQYQSLCVTKRVCVCVRLGSCRVRARR
jgi:hypothetical protein